MTVTPVSFTESVPSPLNLPGLFDCNTTPWARAPFGITGFPRTITGDDTVAVKTSPGFAVLVLMG